MWGMSRMEKSLCEEVSGTEICPEPGNVMIESLWRKDQDDVGKMTMQWSSEMQCEATEGLGQL